MKRCDKIGETRYNNQGSKITIIKYENLGCITVCFDDDVTNSVQTRYHQFQRGSLKNPLFKSIYGVGFLGKGKYKTNTRQYAVWHSMLRRCYDPKDQQRHPSYKDCTVAHEWHNYQVFAKWYDENNFPLPFSFLYSTNLCLDKDILVKGNKIYSAETCLLVSQFINNLFLKRNSSRGDLPIGVSHDLIYLGRYFASCSEDGKPVRLGSFKTIKEAFEAYKYFKENLIQKKAELFKKHLLKKVYDTLMNYKVEIDD